MNGGDWERRRLPAPLHYAATSIIAPQVHLATAELQRRRVLRRHLDLPATLPHDASAGRITPGAPIAGHMPGRRVAVGVRSWTISRLAPVPQWSSTVVHSHCVLVAKPELVTRSSRRVDQPRSANRRACARQAGGSECFALRRLI